MGAFEILVGKSYSDQLMPKVPHVLKSLYDNDYVEEEVFIQWSSKVSHSLLEPYTVRRCLKLHIQKSVIGSCLLYGHANQRFDKQKLTFCSDIE